MTDLAVLAAGFGVIPLAAIILYTVTTRVLAYREAAWGFLAGVLGFLGVSHAMAVVLVNHSLLGDLVCRLLLEKKNITQTFHNPHLFVLHRTTPHTNSLQSPFLSSYIETLLDR